MHDRGLGEKGRWHNRKKQKPSGTSADPTAILMEVQIALIQGYNCSCGS